MSTLKKDKAANAVNNSRDMHLLINTQTLSNSTQGLHDNVQTALAPDNILVKTPVTNPGRVSDPNTAPRPDDFYEKSPYLNNHYLMVEENEAEQVEDGKLDQGKQSPNKKTSDKDYVSTPGIKKSIGKSARRKKLSSAKRRNNDFSDLKKMESPSAASLT